MKRDMDLIRKIMMLLIDGDGKRAGFGISDYSKLGFSDDDEAGGVVDKVMYHISILSQAGFAYTATSLNLPRLTWEGHNFLDMIKDDDVWEKIKSMCDRAGVGVTPHAVEYYHDNLLRKAASPSSPLEVHADHWKSIMYTDASDGD